MLLRDIQALIPWHLLAGLPLKSRPLFLPDDTDSDFGPSTIRKGSADNFPSKEIEEFELSRWKRVGWYQPGRVFLITRIRSR